MLILAMLALLPGNDGPKESSFVVSPVHIEVVRTGGISWDAEYQLMSNGTTVRYLLRATNESSRESWIAISSEELRFFNMAGEQTEVIREQISPCEASNGVGVPPHSSVKFVLAARLESDAYAEAEVEFSVSQGPFCDDDTKSSFLRLRPAKPTSISIGAVR